jgi:predicted ATP-grasp superfamily ATP-dependent carboligase
LAVARSLGRRGIPVQVLDDAYCISSCSRYVQRVIRADNLRGERETIDAILDAGRRFGLQDWVIFPTRDETVAALSKYRCELETFFRVPVPEWDTVKWAWNKKNTYEIAERLGIPCPRTFTVTKAEQLGDLSSHLPLAIKPAIKENFFYRTGAKAWRANTISELHRLFTRARKEIEADEILLQEIIPGKGDTQYSFCAFVKNGHAHSTLVARRERQHPAEFGRAATYVETIEEPEVEELSHRFLKSIDYYGVVEIEFKRDHRDGKFKLLDVNARIWGFHGLGAAAGVDFPYLLFSDQVGMSTARCRSRSGLGWLRLITDVPTSISSIVKGELSLRAWISSVRRTKIESVFALDDPMPSLAEAIMLPYLLFYKYML